LSSDYFAAAVNCFLKRHVEVKAWKLMSVIPAIWEAEVGKITDRGQPRQKVSDPISINKLDVVLCICDPRSQEAIDRRRVVKGPRQKFKTLSEKYPNAKRASDTSSGSVPA
jgi:hypothetical protein